MATLINSIEDLKANMSSLDINFIWESISSYAEDIERDVIAEFIGDEQLEYFKTHTDLEGTALKVQQLLCRAESYLTILKWTQFALFKLSDRALVVATSKDGVIPSDKKLNDLRSTCEQDGFNFLDKAITLMEANLDLFEDYAGSDIRQAVLQGFIKTAGEFDRIRSINKSRTAFMSMLAIMHGVQDDYLPHVMGDDYYQAYKGRYLNDQLTANEQKLLPLITKAVVFLTVAHACKELPVKVTDKGLLVNNFNDTKEYGQANPADLARQQFTMEDAQEKGDRKLAELRRELVNNANLYTGFLIPTEITITPNCEHSGFFIL